MAVWSEVRFSELGNGRRLDAEYFKPEYIALSETLSRQGAVSIGDFACVTDGIHASPDVVHQDDGVRYLSAKCVKDNELSISDTLSISYAQHNANVRTQMRVDDVLVTTVGTIGNAAVVTEEVLPANADRHLGIIRVHPEKNIDPYFLATFLNTRLGRFQTLRESTGNVQLNLFIEKIKTLMVVEVAEREKIATLTRKAYEKRRDSEICYAEAQRLLEEALGLSKLDVAPQLFYERPYSEVEGAARLDAEYACVPDLLSVWRSPYEVRTLGDPTVAKHVNNGATPAASEYGTEGIPIIKVGNITRHGSVEFGGEYVVPGTKTLKSNKGRVRPGDVMVLAAAHHVRYIGKAGLLESWPDSQEKSQAVGELIVVRPGSAIAGEVLTCYLNAPTIRLQVQRLVRGMSAHLYPNDLKTLPVPIVETRIQEQIVAKVRESFSARREAGQLLEEAKAMVERAILGG